MTRPDLLALLKQLPADATVPVGWIRERLDAEPAPEGADPTVETIAAELDRAASTVRGWCPEIPGAYRANGHEWRIPRDGLRRFLEGERRTESRDSARPGEAGAELRAWKPTRDRAS